MLQLLISANCSSTQLFDLRPTTVNEFNADDEDGDDEDNVRG